jgi:hypothetical protein
MTCEELRKSLKAKFPAPGYLFMQEVRRRKNFGAGGLNGNSDLAIAAKHCFVWALWLQGRGQKLVEVKGWRLIGRTRTRSYFGPRKRQGRSTWWPSLGTMNPM